MNEWQEQVTPPHRRPRMFPGYAVAAVSTVAVVLTAPGQTLLVSLLNLPLREEFDIPPLALNVSYTLATILASLPLVWVGKLVDQFGPRRMLSGVALALGGACLFTATIAHPVMIFVAFFLLRFLGQGSLSLVSTHALAMWFHRRLGTIHGIRMVALFAAWAVLPALTSWMIEGWGWRWTWVVFAVVVPGLICPLTWIWVRDSPEEVGLTLDGDAAPAVETEPGFSLSQARRTRAYWLLAAATVLPPMAGTAMIFDIQPLLAARGIPTSAAALVMGGWSISMAIMALPSGRIVDNFAPGPVLTGGMLAVAGSCGLWLVVNSQSGALGAMAAFAVGQSLVAATVGTTAARFFGRLHHGAIRSSLSRMGVIATAMGPLAFGLSQYVDDSFQPALLVFAALCLPPAVAARSLTPPRLPR